MAEAIGVKKMLELVVGLKDLALTAKAVLKDGKIGLEDLPAVMALLPKQAELVAAFSGLGEIVVEAKDISVDEAAQVISALIAAAKEVQAA